MWIMPKNYQPSSVFAADMLESREDLTLQGLDIESSLMWRSKLSPLRTWSLRWKRESWLQHLFGRTLKPFRHTCFEEQLTLSLAAIRANRLARQVSEQEQTIRDTCGHSFDNTSKQLDLLAVFSRTSKAIFRLDSAASLATWKKMVTEQRGEYLARKKLAHRTRESESLSWATPNTMDHMPQRSEEALIRQATTTRKGRAKPSNLREQVNPNAVAIYQEVKSWPTVTTQDNIQIKGKDKRGTTLGGAARRWVTPNARDWRDSVTTMTKPRKDGKKRNDQLPRQIAQLNQKNWPTPDVAQAQKVGNRPNHGQLGLANHPQVHGAECTREPMKKDRAGRPGQDQSNTNGSSQESFGKLNANWVEQLMGIPTGWTELGSWGTE